MQKTVISNSIMLLVSLSLVLSSSALANRSSANLRINLMALSEKIRVSFVFTS